MEQADAAEQPLDAAADAAGDPARHTAALEALLRWYVAMGVDAPIGEEPRDGFAQAERQGEGDGGADAVGDGGRTGSAAPGRVAPRPALAPCVPSNAPQSADALVRQAEALAAAAGTLDALAQAWATLPGCDLAAKSTGMIFSGGRAGAPLMLFGGAPDSDDERQGAAFAGAKGRLLDAMLRAIGLSREDAYLAHVVPWRPPGNRAPTPLELSLCLPFARRQIALAAPRLILCLGERAAQPLLDSREPVSRLRGRFVRFEGEASTVKALVTFSLDYLLKQPLGKRRAWADLQMVAEALQVEAPQLGAPQVGAAIAGAPANGGAETDRLEPTDRD